MDALSLRPRSPGYHGHRRKRSGFTRCCVTHASSNHKAPVGFPKGCKQAAVHPEPSGPGRTSPRSSFRVGVRGHGGLVFQLKLKQGWSQTQPQACEHTHTHTHGFTPLAALKPFFLGLYGTEIRRSERNRSFKPHKHAGTVQSNIPLIQTKSSAGPVWLCWKPAGLASAFPWQK